MKPPQFFYYARSAHRMMKEMGYNLRRGEGLNFRKGQHIPLQPFVPKGKPANYYDQTRRYVTHLFNLIQNSKGLYPHIPQIHQVGNLT